MKIFLNILRSLRMRQWTKNVLLFAALIFSGYADHIRLLLRSLTAFCLFSLCAGSVYIFNDIVDRDRDRCHPVKKSRPIASGDLPVGTAWTVFALLAGLVLVLSFLFSPLFGYAVSGYFLLQIAYR